MTDKPAPGATVIYGASDDLIELDGEISEEFSHTGEEPALLAFGDGTLLEVAYDKDGIWRIKRLIEGASKMEREEGSVEKDTPDRVTLSGADLRWCVQAERGQYNPTYARKKAGRA